jgi:hypothetical protein
MLAIATGMTNVSSYPTVIRRKSRNFNNLRKHYPDATNFGFRPHFSGAEL